MAPFAPVDTNTSARAMRHPTIDSFGKRVDEPRPRTRSTARITRIHTERNTSGRTREKSGSRLELSRPESWASSGRSESKGLLLPHESRELPGEVLDVRIDDVDRDARVDADDERHDGERRQH